MAKIDIIYNNLVEKILEDGREKSDRTNTGTLSLFSEIIKYNMIDGFPLLTTKRVHYNMILHELLWFFGLTPEKYKDLPLTNIKYLVDNKVHIWTEDALRYNYEGKEEEFRKLKQNKNIYQKTLQQYKDLLYTDWDFAEKKGDLGNVYGKQFVDWTKGRKKVNQMENVLNLIKNNPHSRRLLVSAWNAGDLDTMALPPCHFAFEFYIEDLTEVERETLLMNLDQKYYLEKMKNKKYFKSFEKFYKEKKIPEKAISLKWHQRSVDVALGLPFNIASYGTLLLMVAKLFNFQPKMLIGDLTNVHIYKNHLNTIKQQIKRKQYASCKLNVDMVNSFWDYGIDNFELKDYRNSGVVNYELRV